MKPRKRTSNSFGGNFERIGFTTLSLPDFLYFRNLFYKGKRKIVPANIDKLLTRLGLAIWFMDDGSYKSKACREKVICTHGFNIKEIELLCFVLKEKFGLEAIPRKQVDGTEIYILASLYNKLKKLISPYLVSSFNYKLDSFS